MTHKNRKKGKKVYVLKCWMFCFWSGRFLPKLRRLLRRLRDEKIQFFDPKFFKKISAVNFFPVLVIKTLDPELDPHENQCLSATLAKCTVLSNR